MKLPPNTPTRSGELPQYERPKGLTRRTVKGAAGGMKGVDYEDDRRPGIGEGVDGDTGRIALDDDDVRPRRRKKAEGAAEGEAAPTRMQEEPDLVVDADGGVFADELDAPDGRVRRDRLSIDKEPPKHKRRRRSAPDADEDASEDSPDVYFELFSDGVGVDGPAGVSRAHLFEDDRGPQPGEPGLTDPDAIQRALGAPLAYAKHVMILGEAFRRATGATREEAIDYLATMFVAPRDRGFGLAALKEFGPSTGILDVYPLEVLGRVIARHPGLLPKVGFGQLFVDLPSRERPLETDTDTPLRLRYPGHVKVRGFALEGGGRPGYSFAPDAEEGAYVLHIQAPGHFTVLVSALTRSGHTLIDRLHVRVRPGRDAPVLPPPDEDPYPPRDAAKVAAWPMPEPPVIDTEALLLGAGEPEGEPEDDGLMSAAELLSRRTQDAMVGARTTAIFQVPAELEAELEAGLGAEADVDVDDPMLQNVPLAVAPEADADTAPSDRLTRTLDRTRVDPRPPRGETVVTEAPRFEDATPAATPAARARSRPPPAASTGRGRPASRGSAPPPPATTASPFGAPPAERPPPPPEDATVLAPALSRTRSAPRPGSRPPTTGRPSAEPPARRRSSDDAATAPRRPAPAESGTSGAVRVARPPSPAPSRGRRAASAPPAPASERAGDRTGAVGPPPPAEPVTPPWDDELEDGEALRREALAIFSAAVVEYAREHDDEDFAVPGVPDSVIVPAWDDEAVPALEAEHEDGSAELEAAREEDADDDEGFDGALSAADEGVGPSRPAPVYGEPPAHLLALLGVPAPPPRPVSGPPPEAPEPPVFGRPPEDLPPLEPSLPEPPPSPPTRPSPSPSEPAAPTPASAAPAEQAGVFRAFRPDPTAVASRPGLPPPGAFGFGAAPGLTSADFGVEAEAVEPRSGPIAFRPGSDAPSHRPRTAPLVGRAGDLPRVVADGRAEAGLPAQPTPARGGPAVGPPSAFGLAPPPELADAFGGDAPGPAAHRAPAPFGLGGAEPQDWGTEPADVPTDPRGASPARAPVSTPAALETRSPDRPAAPRFDPAFVESAPEMDDAPEPTTPLVEPRPAPGAFGFAPPELDPADFGGPPLPSTHAPAPPGFGPPVLESAEPPTPRPSSGAGGAVGAWTEPEADFFRRPRVESPLDAAEAEEDTVESYDASVEPPWPAGAPLAGTFEPTPDVRTGDPDPAPASRTASRLAPTWVEPSADAFAGLRHRPAAEPVDSALEDATPPASEEVTRFVSGWTPEPEAAEAEDASTDFDAVSTLVPDDDRPDAAADDDAMPLLDDPEVHARREAIGRAVFGQGPAPVTPAPPLQRAGPFGLDPASVGLGDDAVGGPRREGETGRSAPRPRPPVPFGFGAGAPVAAGSVGSGAGATRERAEARDPAASGPVEVPFAEPSAETFGQVVPPRTDAVGVPAVVPPPGLLETPARAEPTRRIDMRRRRSEPRRVVARATPVGEPTPPPAIDTPPADVHPHDVTRRLDARALSRPRSSERAEPAAPGFVDAPGFIDPPRPRRIRSLDDDEPPYEEPDPTQAELDD